MIIPESVEKICKKAFYGCSGLTGDLTIPESVEKICDSAFKDCSGLTKIRYYDGTGVGENVFPKGIDIEVLNPKTGEVIKTYRA